MVTKNTIGKVSDHKQDDLTVIPGIGQVIAERLHQAGIHTFSHLAKCSPRDILPFIQGLRGVKPDQLNKLAHQIIDEASLLAEEQEGALASGAGSNGHYHRTVVFTIRLQLDKENSVIRTTIERASKKSVKPWEHAGWDEAGLIDFLVTNARLNISPKLEPGLEPGASPPEEVVLPARPVLEPVPIPKPINPAPVAPTTPMRSATRKLRGIPYVQEPHLFSLQDERLLNWVNAGETFTVRLGLDLRDVENPDQDQLVYELTLFVKPIGSHSRIQTACLEGILQPGETCEIELQAASLSPGDYLLDAIVALRPASLPNHPINRILGYMEGKRLRAG